MPNERELFMAPSVVDHEGQVVGRGGQDASGRIPEGALERGVRHPRLARGRRVLVRGRVRRREDDDARAFHGDAARRREGSGIIM